MPSEDDANYTQADRLRATDPAGAARLLEVLIARKPDHPNALNLLGWLLTSQLNALARGLTVLQRAVALFPDDPTALSNLVEALVDADRAAEALATVTAATDRSPSWQEAWNLSGWLKAMKLGRLDDGIADFRRATGLSAWYGNAHFNLGRALLLKGEERAALEAFRCSTVRGSFRDHEAYLRLGEGDERAGKLRRALGHYRQAARLDAFSEYTPQLHEAINRVGNALLRAGKYLLHGEDEHRRFDYLRAHHTLAGLERVTASEIAAAARKHEPSPGIALIIATMDAGALLPRLADQSAQVLLADDGLPLLKRYFAAWMRLYDALLDAEEPHTPGDAGLYRLIHERKFAEAAAEIAGWKRSADPELCWSAAVAELAADLAWLFDEQACALELYALAEDAFARYASGSSSGAEGMQRMADVNRVRTKRQRSPLPVPSVDGGPGA